MIKGHIHVKDYPWGDIVTHRDTYRRGRNLGLAAGLFLGGCVGFIIGLTTNSEASTYECKSFREILEGFEYDYHPRYEAPPMKPTGE